MSDTRTKDQWSSVEPSVDELTDDKGETFRQDQAQYINWLRAGVRALIDDGMTPRQIKENWTELRKDILRRHGYLQDE